MTAKWSVRATTKRCTPPAYNQNFRDAGVSVYLNYTRHTYWDREEQTNYNIMLSHYFNMGSIRNMSVSLTGYRYEYDNRADKGM